MNFTPGPWMATDQGEGPRGKSLGISISRPNRLPLFFLPRGTAEHDANARLVASAPAQHAALNAVLLFHSASPWDEQKREAWRAITGANESTAKVLCDHVRAVLAKVEPELNRRVS